MKSYQKTLRVHKFTSTNLVGDCRHFPVFHVLGMIPFDPPESLSWLFLSQLFCFYILPNYPNSVITLLSQFLS